MKLIDKDTLVAEIKARISDVEVSQKAGLIKKGDANKKIFLFKSVLLLIDTLEVKEVDLDYIKEELDRLIRIQKPDGDFGWGTLYNVATHFFELGLKAHKGEKV